MQHQFQHGILKVNVRQDVQVSNGIHHHALKSMMSSEVYAELPIIIIHATLPNFFRKLPRHLI